MELITEFRGSFKRCLHNSFEWIFFSFYNCQSSNVKIQLNLCTFVQGALICLCSQNWFDIETSMFSRKRILFNQQQVFSFVIYVHENYVKKHFTMRSLMIEKKTSIEKHVNFIGFSSVCLHFVR